jgi:hypothetical protein
MALLLECYFILAVVIVGVNVGFEYGWVGLGCWIAASLRFSQRQIFLWIGLLDCRVATLLAKTDFLWIGLFDCRVATLLAKTDRAGWAEMNPP